MLSLSCLESRCGVLMKKMECWVLLGEVQDRMIREPDDQVRGMLAGGVAMRG
jgi:hypothetical protein